MSLRLSLLHFLPSPSIPSCGRADAQAGLGAVPQDVCEVVLQQFMRLERVQQALELVQALLAAKRTLPPDGCEFIVRYCVTAQASAQAAKHVVHAPLQAWLR